MFIFKGSNRLCIVVELSMQYCVYKFVRIHLRHIYKTILRCIIIEFERKVDFQTHLFRADPFLELVFLKLLNNDDKNVNKILQ